MKKLLTLAGVLALSAGTTCVAGDRLVAHAHGGSVYQRTPTQHETTVALYSGERDVVVVDRVMSGEPTERRMIQTEGRSGYRMHVNR